MYDGIVWLGIAHTVYKSKNQSLSLTTKNLFMKDAVTHSKKLSEEIVLVSSSG